MYTVKNHDVKMMLNYFQKNKQYYTLKNIGKRIGMSEGYFNRLIKDIETDSNRKVFLKQPKYILLNNIFNENVYLLQDVDVDFILWKLALNKDLYNLTSIAKFIGMHQSQLYNIVYKTPPREGRQVPKTYNFPQKYHQKLLEWWELIVTVQE